MDAASLLRLALPALLLAALPLGWLWLQRRHERQPAPGASSWLPALTSMTLFLVFDLIVLGAYTRLSDSGLGCPDWPGCYAQASPLGARDAIAAAHAAAPSGPVSWSKAWIEMLHRYLAMGVGALVLVLAFGSWLRRRQLPHSAWLPTSTLLWVVVQGLFGKYTVTLKLYPAVVTLHLLGGLVLLALLAVQHAGFSSPQQPVRLPPALRRATAVAAVLLIVQIALGGWVSTNYAVLACGDGFPRCNGNWWPAMDAGDGFTLLRELGRTASGASLPFGALVAIHMAHRVFAGVVALALGALAWSLFRTPGLRRAAAALAALLFAQLASGLSNVVLGWPLFAALAHSAGAAALVLVLTSLLARSARRPAPVAAWGSRRLATA